jgi:hypothetical protein
VLQNTPIRESHRLAAGEERNPSFR